jgi:putative membrane protein
VTVCGPEVAHKEEDMDHPYSRFTNQDLILRDHLANERTVLANERTFLAYIRTALAFFISGVSFIKFFDSPILHVFGWFFIPSGAVIFIIGLESYRKMRHVTRMIKTASPLRSGLTSTSENE